MLQEQVVSLPFVSGIDTKTDEKIVPEGTLLELENGVFGKSNSIKKRYGRDLLTKNTTSGTLTSATGISSVKNELLLLDNNKLYSYSEAKSLWQYKGKISPCIVKSEVVRQNLNNHTSTNSAQNTKYFFVCCEEFVASSSYKIRITQIDKMTGSIIKTYSIDEGSNVLKITATESKVYVLSTGAASTNLRYAVIDISTETISAMANLKTDVSTSYKYFDVANDGTNLYVIYPISGPKVKVCKFDPVLTTLVEKEHSASPYANFNVGIIYNTYTNCPYIYYYDAATVIAKLDSALDIVTSSLLVTEFRKVIGLNFDSEKIYGITEQTPSLGTFDFFTYDHDLANYTEKSFSLGTNCELASVPFKMVNDYFFITKFNDTAQGQYFVVDSDGFVAARFSYGRAGPTDTLYPNVALNVNQYQDSVVFFTERAVRSEAVNGEFSLSFGVARYDIDFSIVNSNRQFNFAEEQYFTGGYLAKYDGESVIENDFFVFPKISNVIKEVGSGNLSAGTYQYVAVYEFIDNNGKIHRSAPSIPYSYTASSGDKVTVVVSSCLFTNKRVSSFANRDSVSVAIYRTTANGTIFYKLSFPPLNDLSSATVTYNDEFNADSDIIGNELLYTTGGILENISPNSCFAWATSPDRIFITDTENNQDIGYSKKSNDNDTAHFSDFLTIRSSGTAQNESREITALGYMDDKLIATKGNSIYATSGDGPNNAGIGDTFAPLQFVTSATGCSNFNSMTQTPNGLMFQTAKGIYLLGRDLQISYIGAPVEKYNSQAITNALAVPSTNEIRFLCSSGLSLMYDFYFNKWGTFQNYNGVDAAIWKGKYCFVQSDGQVCVENTSFLDGTTQIFTTIETAWIKLAGLQGFQRIKRASILGDFKSNHTLKIKVAYDYKDVYVDEYIIDPVSNPIDSVYQFQIHLKQQKCQAIKFRIEEQPSDTPGESFSLTDLSLLVGIKKGMNKVPYAKKV